jgi:hypothetical protein
MEQQESINQQERMAQDMRVQNEWYRQHMYQANRQNTINQIVQGLYNVDPLEVIRMINCYHNVSFLPLEQNERNYLLQLIGSILNDPNSDFTVESWKNLVSVLNTAINLTRNIQTNMIGGGGYYQNQYGAPMGNMGMSMGGMGYPGPMGGMGMPMGNPYGMMGGPQMGMGYQYPGSFGYQPQPQKSQDAGLSEEEKDKAAIAEFKNVFATWIWQTDPIVFLNSLIFANYELKPSENKDLENALRQAIANSLWRVHDNTLSIFYNVVSVLCANEYQKKFQDNKQNQQFNNMGFQYPGMQMGGMTPPMNGMGMGMPMNGMPMGNMGMPMGMNQYGAPMGNMGMQMPGMGMPGMQMPMGGMTPPMNGMGMGMPMNGMPIGGMNQFGGPMGGMGMGMPMGGTGYPGPMGGVNQYGGPQKQSHSSAASPIWGENT